MKVAFLSNEPYSVAMGSTNRQRLARAARDAGWTVSYIETIGWQPRRPHPEDVDGIEVVPAWNALPYSARPLNNASRFINKKLSTAAFGSILSAADVIVYFDPVWWVQDVRWQARKIYDCLDAYEFQPQYSSTLARTVLKRCEQSLARKVDVTTAVTQNLASSKSARWGVPVATVNGAFEPWATKDKMVDLLSVNQDEPRSRRALLVSALDDYKVDFDSLAQLAVSHADWTFDIFGKAIFEEGPKLRNFLALPNVNRYAPVRLAELPLRGTRYDVGLIALSSEPYSRHSFPLKVWDYMALGLPVIAFNAPGLQEVDGVLSFKHMADISLDSVEISAARSRELIDIAYQNSAARRWDRMLQL